MATGSNDIPAQLLDKLALVRRRKLLVGFGVAALVAFAVFMVAMVGAMFIDWTFTLFSSSLRFMLLLVAIGAAITSLALGITWAVRRSKNLATIAADVDRNLPELEERWSTVTEISERSKTDPRRINPAMMSHVTSEALEFAPHVSPSNVVSWQKVRRPLAVVAGVIVVLIGAFLLDWRQTAVLIGRFWAPASNISMTSIDGLDDVVVARGEELTINATLNGRSVDEATLFIRPATGANERQTLFPKGDTPQTLRYRERTAEESFDYRIRAGDGQSDWHGVVVADRPALSAVKVKLTHPAYTQKADAEHRSLPEKLSAVEGSVLDIAFQTESEVQSFQLKLGDDTGATLTVGQDGWYRWTKTLDESFVMSPILTEAHGLENRDPPICRVDVLADEAPEVKIITPNDSIAVRPDDTIDIEFEATDDYGISHAELIVYDDSNLDGGEPQEIMSIDIPLDLSSDPTDVKGNVELDLAKLDLKDGESISYAVRVHDTREAAAEGSPNAPSSTAGMQNTANAGGRPENSNPSNEQVASSQNANPQAEVSSASAFSNTDEVADASSNANSSAASSNGQNSQNGNMNSATPSDSVASSNGQGSPADAQDQNSSNSAAASQSSTAQNQSNQNPSDGSSESGPNSPAQDPASNAVASNQSGSNQNSSASGSSSDGSQSNANSSNSSQQSGSGSSSSSESQSQRAMAANGDPSSQNQPSDNATANNSPNNNGQNPSSNPSQSNATASNSQQQNGSGSSSSSTSPSQSAMASNGQPSSSMPGRPADNMTRRSLDIGSAQAGSSNRQSVTIDRWAGSFDGQSREKLEIAIAPVIEELDRHLADAENSSRELLDSIAAGESWMEPHSTRLESTGDSVMKAIELVDELAAKTEETPYAFVGLTVVDISNSQIYPARDEFWEAKQSEAPERTEQIQAGWQYVQRARQLLAALTKQYEKVQRDYELAESIEHIENMYQVFIENAHALLGGGTDDLGGLQRKMAEFELDEEYLARLKEVLEMRQELLAEFARMLTDDPRLLQRYRDRVRQRSKTLRYELAELTDRQKSLAREVRAHEASDESQQKSLERTFLRTKLAEVEKIATAAAELEERFGIWLPLDMEIKDGALAEARETAKEVAASSRELLAEASKAATEESSEKAANDVKSIYRQADLMSRNLTSLEAALRTVSIEDDRADLATHVVRRLADTQNLITQTEGWKHKIRELTKGNYHLAAEVEQHQLTTDTSLLAGKLADIENQLAGSLGGELPEEIAEKAQELMKTLDEDVATNQLGAVYALRESEMPSAIARQSQAVVGMEKAEQLLHEVLTKAIEELDKLPVQDPIASALEDPTLDELLAALEQELDSADDLGIPPRPNNLQTNMDMMTPGSGSGAGGSGGMSGMAGAAMQLGAGNQQLQDKLQQAYQEALGRALNEQRRTRTAAKKSIRRLPNKDGKRWLVGSELGDDLLQGSGKVAPEQYREAIEQYFDQISRLRKEQQEDDE
ncbi:MAG: hypothetical protein KDB27_08875 [Planctomycetales bacterium]|nr:hypothetical protein [Planctomycetales bacterium]